MMVTIKQVVLFRKWNIINCASIWSEIRSAPQILINLFLGTHRDCLLKRVRLNPESRGLQESVLAKVTVYVITDNNYLGLGFSLLQSLYAALKCCAVLPVSSRNSESFAISSPYLAHCFPLFRFQ